MKSFLTWLLDSENLATAIVNVVRSFHTAVSYTHLTLPTIYSV